MPVTPTEQRSTAQGAVSSTKHQSKGTCQAGGSREGQHKPAPARRSNREAREGWRVQSAGMRACAHLCCQALHDAIVQRLDQRLQQVGRQAEAGGRAEFRAAAQRSWWVRAHSRSGQLESRRQTCAARAALPLCQRCPMAPHLHAGVHGRPHIRPDHPHQLLAHPQRFSRHLQAGAIGRGHYPVRGSQLAVPLVPCCMMRMH